MGNKKNKKPKKKSRKGPVSKKSCSSQASPGQKENRPKKTIVKLDPGDRIAMSQELMKHTKRRVNDSRSRTKQDSKRVLPNGIIMPSLADLEKMYEDSDDDTDSKDLPKADTSTSSVDNIVIDINTILSPNTCAKGSQQCKEIWNKWSKTHENDATTSKIQSPPKKRLKLGTWGYPDECEDLPLVTTTPKKILCDISDTQVIESYVDDLGISPIPELNKNDKKETGEGNLSGTSVASNETLKYKITPPTLQSNITWQAFNPMPSTSRDDGIISKNDKLFFKCTQEINNNKIKEENSPITDIQKETREFVEKVIVEESQEEVKKEVVNDNEIVDTIDQNNLSTTTNPGDKKCDYDDDDCIIVDCFTNTTKQASKEPDIINLEYDFIDTDTYNYHTSDVDGEVIDVDALIAKNQAILKKYKTTDTNKLNSTNLVVDVDVSTIVENSIERNNRQEQNNKQIIPSTAPSTSNNTSNLQKHLNHEDEVINITDLDSENRRYNQVRNNLSSNQSVIDSDIIEVESTSYQSEYQHTFTEEDLAEFFNGNSSTHQNDPPCELGNYMLDLVQQLEFENYSANQFLETSRRAYDIPVMFQNSSHVPVTSQRTLSGFPIYQQTEPSSSTLSSQRTQPSHTTTKKKKRTRKITETAVQPSPVKSSRKTPKECPICMEILDEQEVASTICGHLFCMSCLKQALKTTKKCPTCRKTIKKNGYHKVFM